MHILSFIIYYRSRNDLQRHCLFCIQQFPWGILQASPKPIVLVPLDAWTQHSDYHILCCSGRLFHCRGGYHCHLPKCCSLHRGTHICQLECCSPFRRRRLNDAITVRCRAIAAIGVRLRGQKPSPRAASWTFFFTIKRDSLLLECRLPLQEGLLVYRTAELSGYRSHTQLMRCQIM
jgi:hypothetical protein